MKSQITRLITANLVIAVVVFGFARMESRGGTTESQGLRQLVVDLQHEMAGLNATVQRQSAAINTLQTRINAQDSTITVLNNTVRSQGEKLKFVTVDGTEMYITGANLNIRNGSGATSGTMGSPYVAQPNGLGNLIIGYNENGIPPCGGCTPQDERPRTGSHNLVLGVDNGYTSIGGIVVGFANAVTNSYATVTGGAYSTASGLFSTVSGGELNTANVEGAAISGGLQGIASGRWSSVSGGSKNTASEESAAVCGGSANTASGLFSSVSGGTGNTVSGQSSSISGGGYVVVDHQFAWAAGSLVWP